MTTTTTNSSERPLVKRGQVYRTRVRSTGKYHHVRVRSVRAPADGGAYAIVVETDKHGRPLRGIDPTLKIDRPLVYVSLEHQAGRLAMPPRYRLPSADDKLEVAREEAAAAVGQFIAAVAAVARAPRATGKKRVVTLAWKDGDVALGGECEGARIPMSGSYKARRLFAGTSCTACETVKDAVLVALQDARREGALRVEDGDWFTAKRVPGVFVAHRGSVEWIAE